MSGSRFLMFKYLDAKKEQRITRLRAIFKFGMIKDACNDTIRWPPILYAQCGTPQRDVGAILCIQTA